jgi:hypothetical protein
MRRNILMDDELKGLNDKYEFTYDGGYVVARSKATNQKTVHSPKFSFIISVVNTKPLISVADVAVRHVVITPEDCLIWIGGFIGRATLPDVHNAISILLNTNEKVTADNVAKYLR